MSETPMYFGKLQRLFFEHYNREEYQEALAFLDENAAAVPDYSGMTLAWRAGMHCLTDDAVGGLSLLEEGYASGLWYHEEALANDPDYVALREVPAFQDLLKRFRERRLAEEAALVPHLALLEPPAATPQPWPLLIALHGNGGNSTEFAPHFTPAARMGWLVAVPESFDKTWVSGHYDWRDYASACRDLQNHISLLKDRCDPSRLVLGGYSMGGQIALQAALTGDIPARGFIGFEGWIFDDNLFKQVLERTTRHDLRVYLVSGTHPDFCYWAQKVQELLTEAGIACELEMKDNEYHRLPADMDQVLGRALAYICG